ncbi:MAG: hypothetical protein ACI88A_003707 [Paraglaciecola sp.]|jgi:hypothetical protein
MSVRSILKRNLFVALAGVFLLPAIFMTVSANTESQDKVYELRTYHTNEGKMSALQGRFRDHTHTIFKRLGMKVIAYWVPIKDPEASNTLIYIIEHDSEADAKQKWQTFIKDPTWVKAYQASIKEGPLVKSIDVVFMQKTDFSPEL